MLQPSEFAPKEDLRLRLDSLFADQAQVCFECGGGFVFIPFFGGTGAGGIRFSTLQYSVSFQKYFVSFWLSFFCFYFIGLARVAVISYPYVGISLALPIPLQLFLFRVCSVSQPVTTEVVISRKRNQDGHWVY